MGTEATFELGTWKAPKAYVARYLNDIAVPAGGFCGALPERANEMTALELAKAAGAVLVSLSPETPETPSDGSVIH